MISKESLLKLVCVVVVLVLTASLTSAVILNGRKDLSEGLLFGFPLTSNFRSLTKHGKLTSHDVSLGQDGAVFNGGNSFVDVDHEGLANLGNADFTMALRVKIEEAEDDMVGSLVSMYSEKQMSGLTFSIDSRTGMTSSQANLRNVFFGMNDGDKSPPIWREEGRLGAAHFIGTMAVFEGNLYVGTLEYGEKGGRVYRYIAPDRWEDMDFPTSSNLISTLAEFNGRLCAGTHMYRFGSGLVVTEDLTRERSGKVYCWNPSNQGWEFEGEPNLHILDQQDRFPDTVPSISAFTVFNGSLFAASAFTPHIYRFNGSKQWELLSSPSIPKLNPPDGRVLAMGIWNGKLYAAMNDSGGVARLASNNKWQLIGLRTLQNYSLSVYRGSLIVGTFDDGFVGRYLKDDSWISMGRLGNEDEVMALTDYNGNLYGGTLPNGEIYRYDLGRRWTKIGRLGDDTGSVGERKNNYSDGHLRRVWNFAVFKGRLFAGTLPSGRVYSTMVGQAVSDDYSLAPGWHHLAVTRSGKHLSLFRDGKLVSSNTSDRVIDLKAGPQFFLGKGTGDFLNGVMRDFRLYKRALSADEIIELAQVK